MQQSFSDADFARLCTYIHSHYGIDLHKKKDLVASRLTRIVAAGGYGSFTQYTDDIISGRHPELVSAMLNRLTTNYTYFLREEEHFTFFQRTVLPELAQKHRLDHSPAVWSAGCSSGEEPYTLSMYLMEYFGARTEHWDTTVLATDLSGQVLQQAKAPAYSEDSLRSLPEAWRRKYFRRTPSGAYTVCGELRRNVVFRQFNLMEPIRFRRKFDVIFCRNVMIYFDKPTKAALVQRLYEATVPGGYLFIGHSESLDKESCPYRYLRPALYRKAP